MAEQDTDQQHSAEGEEEESTNVDHNLILDEGKQDGADTATQQQTEASSSASTNQEINSENGDDAEQPGIKNSNSAGESVASLTEGSSPPADHTVGTVKENSATLEVEAGSHCDYTRDMPRHEQPRVSVECSYLSVQQVIQTSSITLTLTSQWKGEDDAGQKKAAEATSPPPLGDGDNVDGPDIETLDSDAGENVGSSQEEQENGQHENTTCQQTGENIELIENIGPVTQDTAEAEPPGPVVTAKQRGATVYLLLLGLFGVVLAVLGHHFLFYKSPPQKEDLRQIDIFLGELDKVKTQFPNQRAELWTRSRIHLLRHLQTAQPSEPVSLILTAGRGGERTLHCLAQRLASAFSSSLNASVLHIDGAGKASQDSDQVKLDIDSQLQGAFEGDKPVAVINRFDELPPGSTLIFYRYCDHENAAYKKTCLIFTVLLGEEEEIPAETRLSTVEEMVDDHLQKKFLSHGHPVSFDRMDLDKYGGLWSRISHLILPVAAEGRLEHDGC